MSATLTEEVLSTLKQRDSTNGPPVLRLEADTSELHESLPPSYFPCLDARPGIKGALQSTEVSFRDINRLRSFCRNNYVSSLSVFHAAWALVLRCYLGNLSVCFACKSSQLAENGEEKLAINHFDDVCQVEVGDATTILDILKKFCKSQQAETQSSIYEPSRGSDVLPMNTSLVYREVGQQDWSGMGGLAVQEYASTSLINV